MFTDTLFKAVVAQGYKDATATRQFGFDPDSREFIYIFFIFLSGNEETLSRSSLDTQGLQNSPEPGQRKCLYGNSVPER